MALTTELKLYREMEEQRRGYEEAESKRKWNFIWGMLAVTAATVGIKLAEVVGIVR